MLLTLEGWLLPERPEPLHGRHGQVPVRRVGELHLGRGEQLAPLQHLPRYRFTNFLDGKLSNVSTTFVTNCTATPHCTALSLRFVYVPQGQREGNCTLHPFSSHQSKGGRGRGGPTARPKSLIVELCLTSLSHLTCTCCTWLLYHPIEGCAFN